MSAVLSLNGSASILHKSPTTPARTALSRRALHRGAEHGRRRRWFGAATPRRWLVPLAAGPRADDSSAPFEMSVEGALKLLGVSEGASFDDILRAKKDAVSACEDNPEAVAQVEAAYDMLLMQSLTQRRAGKVVSSSIRYADVKPIKTSGTSALPQWVQATVKNIPVSFESPSPRDLGIQAGVYGALMVFTYVSGSSSSSTLISTGAEVPGIILATGFGASIYFLTKKTTSLGKAALITAGGLVVGAVVGSAVEKWLQVDIIPVFGIQSPAVIVTELILFSQLVVSLYLRLIPDSYYRRNERASATNLQHI